MHHHDGRPPAPGGLSGLSGLWLHCDTSEPITELAMCIVMKLGGHSVRGLRDDSSWSARGGSRASVHRRVFEQLG
jgi:hypothetical protein